MAVIPEYAKQAAPISTQPVLVVTQPASYAEHDKSVMKVAARSVQILLAHVAPHVHPLKYVIVDNEGTYYY